MKRPWIFLLNPFTAATDQSYRMAVRISTYHDSALHAAVADAYISDLYDIYHPIHEAQMTVYNTWVSQGGLQQGDTLNLRQLLRLLSNSKINFWDASISLVYAPDTPTYKGLFPNGHAPFQQGTQTERMAAVAALIDSIGTDAALATIKTNVVAFNTQLITANTDQKGSISITKTLSDAVDAARITMCIAQYANLGSMMNHWANATDNIEQYFDLEAIRKGQQVFFTNSVKATKIKFIVKHTFADADRLRITNTGDVNLKFYLADSKTAPAPVTAITVDAGEIREVTAPELGNIANAFLLVYNPDTLNKGEYDVELL